MNQQKPKRKRLTVGRLVSSTNSLVNIQVKRLVVAVAYCTEGFHNRIVCDHVLSVRTNYAE